MGNLRDFSWSPLSTACQLQLQGLNGRSWHVAREKSRVCGGLRPSTAHPLQKTRKSLDTFFPSSVDWWRKQTVSHPNLYVSNATSPNVVGILIDRSHNEFQSVLDKTKKWFVAASCIHANTKLIEVNLWNQWLKLSLLENLNRTVGAFLWAPPADMNASSSTSSRKAESLSCCPGHLKPSESLNKHWE